MAPEPASVSVDLGVPARDHSYVAPMRRVDLTILATLPRTCQASVDVVSHRPSVVAITTSSTRSGVPPTRVEVHQTLGPFVWRQLITSVPLERSSDLQLLAGKLILSNDLWVASPYVISDELLSVIELGAAEASADLCAMLGR